MMRFLSNGHDIAFKCEIYRGLLTLEVKERMTPLYFLPLIVDFLDTNLSPLRSLFHLIGLACLLSSWLLALLKIHTSGALPRF